MSIAGLLAGTCGPLQAQKVPAKGAAKQAAVSPAAAPKVGVPKADDKYAKDVVARIGDQDITVHEVRTYLAGLNDREQAALTQDPALLSQTLRVMLANRLVLREAAAKKWEETPTVAAQLRLLRDNALVESYLKSVSVPPADYPGDADVQKAYEANKSAFVVPRQFQLGQIYVALAQDADKAAEDAARKKLSGIQAKLKQPKADFAAIAKESSDQKDSAARGGDIGWVAESQVRPEIKSQVVGLAKGAVGEPVKLSDGWHIVKLLDTKPAATRPLDDVRPLLIQRLRAQRTEVLRRSYLARLLEESPPVINELALSKIFGPAPEKQSQAAPQAKAK